MMEDAKTQDTGAMAVSSEKKLADAFDESFGVGKDGD